jgi:hypothetical protein
LIKDARQTWYIDTAGAVTWVVDELDVRSDARAPGDRQQEEAAYWLAVQQERHDVAAGLRELSGLKPRTVVLRAEAPFSVRTEAKFPGLDVLGQRLIAALGTGGTSLVKRDADRWEWTLTVRDPSVAGSTVEPSEGVEELIGTLDQLRVVLIAGRFEDASGFLLSDDHRIARFNAKDPSGSGAETEIVTLRLVWR